MRLIDPTLALLGNKRCTKSYQARETENGKE